MFLKKIILLFIFILITSLSYTIDNGYYASQKNDSSAISAKKLILTKTLNEQGVPFNKANKLIGSLSNEEINKLYIEKENLIIGKYYTNADILLMFVVVGLVLWALGAV